MGYRRLLDQEAPNASVRDFAGEPFIVEIPGEKTPVLSTKIDGYLNPFFWHYNDIVNRCLTFGLPYASWFDCPEWLLDLIQTFKDIDKEVEIHFMNKSN